jgi:hypothetical protein
VQAKGIGNIFKKVIAVNFPNLEKEMPSQGQEAFRMPNRQDQTRISPYNIIVQTLSIENKKSILKVAREKHQVHYKGRPIRKTANFSTTTKGQEGIDQCISSSERKQLPT